MQWEQYIHNVLRVLLESLMCIENVINNIHRKFYKQCTTGAMREACVSGALYATL